MAKCIKYYRQHGSHVDRVSDVEAADQVQSGRATYCPKHWWKAAKLKEAQEAVE